jgi:hypothetical protein
MTENKPQKRNRSPAYPYSSLREALEKAREFYKQNGEYHSAVNDAVDGLGFSSKSSAGFRVLSSLLQFGLLEEDGAKDNRVVWLSELGRQFVLDFYESDSDEYRQLIQQTALRPKIYEILYEKWSIGKTRQLPNVNTMRRELIRDHEFNPQSVERFISEFTDTLEFAMLIGAKATSMQSDIPTDNSANISPHSRLEVKSHPISDVEAVNNPGTRRFVYPARNGDVILTIPDRLTADEYRRFRTWLDLIDYNIIREDGIDTTD